MPLHPPLISARPHDTLQAISIVFFTETWRPDSFYDRILANRRQGLHTLCLLDIKVKEPTLESLARGRKVYEAPRYMTVNTAVEQLLEVEDNRQVVVLSILDYPRGPLFWWLVI